MGIFEGFTLERVDVGPAQLRVRHGGCASGPSGHRDTGCRTGAQRSFQDAQSPPAIHQIAAHGGQVVWPGGQHGDLGASRAQLLHFPQQRARHPAPDEPFGAGRHPGASQRSGWPPGPGRRHVPVLPRPANRRWCPSALHRRHTGELRCAAGDTSQGLSTRPQPRQGTRPAAPLGARRPPAGRCRSPPR